MDRVQELNLLLDTASKIFNILFKLGLVMGGGLLFIYFLSIGYLPKEMAIGDGLMFLWVVFCFGIFYVLIVFLLANTAVLFSPLVIGFMKGIDKVVVFLFPNGRTKRGSLNSPRLRFPVILFGLVGLGLILLSYTVGLRTLISFICVTLLLSLFVPMLLDVSSRLADLKNELNGAIFLKEANNDDNNIRHDHLRRGRVVLSALVILTPFIVIDFSKTILNGAMNYSGIKKEGVELYISEPYARLMTTYGEVKDSSDAKLLDGYIKFNDMNVLLHGIGKIMVIESERGNIEIPSKFVIIGKASANKMMHETSS